MAAIFPKSFFGPDTDDVCSVTAVSGAFHAIICCGMNGFYGMGATFRSDMLRLVGLRKTFRTGNPVCGLPVLNVLLCRRYCYFMSTLRAVPSLMCRMLMPGWGVEIF